MFSPRGQPLWRRSVLQKARLARRAILDRVLREIENRLRQRLDRGVHEKAMSTVRYEFNMGGMSIQEHKLRKIYSSVRRMVTVVVACPKVPARRGTAPPKETNCQGQRRQGPLSVHWSLDYRGGSMTTSTKMAHSAHVQFQTVSAFPRTMKPALGRGIQPYSAESPAADLTLVMVNAIWSQTRSWPVIAHQHGYGAAPRAC